MDRKGVFAYCRETFGVLPDYPWGQDDAAVLRHEDNRKWFALVMEIPASKLSSGREGRSEVVNLKIAPEMAGSFDPSEGVYPAYHMNKGHWVSVMLNDAPDDVVTFLLGVSFELTRKKVHIPKKRKDVDV